MKIENVSVAGFEPAIRGMRNPYDSWDKSDSVFCDIKECGYSIGGADLKLMQDLARAGSEHRKYLRMIIVWMDITAPRYWWHEFDTYKIGTVANSCSTMHTLTSKPITLDDFEVDDEGYSIIYTIEKCEVIRQKYLETKDKKYWRQLIQLLPQSYLQKRTVMMNYETCHNIYQQRGGHKLKEWEQMRKTIKELPYFLEIFS